VGDLLQLRDAHERAQLLLPWRVNGTIEPGDSAVFEAHLAECAECRDDLAANLALRELYANVPVTSMPMRHTLPRALEAGSAPATRTDWRFLKQRLSTGWSRAAQAALAAAAAVAAVLLVAPAERDGEYRLLGSNAPAAQGNAIVLFSPDTTERDLRAALEQAGARLVDGPTASGAYIVQVPGQERAAALAGLRALPQVVLAEPVDAPGEP
jgi:anti-sigma factor RsiW